MKKLLIASVALAMTVVANAASMTWYSGTMSMPSGGEPDDDITGYLFVLDSTAYGKITGADYVWNTYKSQLTSASETAVDGLGDITLSDPNTYSSGDSAYAAIIYKTSESEKDYYIANYGTYTFDSSYDRSQSNMGLLLNGTGSALSWTEVTSGPEPVPEPFSGSLALLGVGLVALRRKMKKQKK